MLKKIAKKIIGTLTEKILIKGTGTSKATMFDDISVSHIKAILRNGDFSQTMKLYRTMLKRDWQISGDLQERKLKVLSSSYLVTGKQHVEFIQDYLDQIKLTSLLSDINSGIDYGFSIIDLVWENSLINNNTAFVPTKFNFIKQIMIQKDTKKGLFIQDDKNQKHFLEEQSLKILFHTHKMDSGDMLDYSTLSKLIWIFTIKSFITAQYMNFAELMGVPPIIVNSEAKDKDTIMDMFDQVLELRSGSAGVFGKEDKVSLIEGKGSGEMFMKFLKYADNAIAHIILGGTVSSSDSNSGSYARDKTHNDVKKAFHKADMQLISETINDLIKRILDLNFNDVKEYPKFTLILDEDIELETTANAYKTLQDMGIDISKDQIQQLFKLKRKVSQQDLATPLAKQSSKTNNTVQRNFREFNSKKPLDHIDVQINSLDTVAIEEQTLNEIQNIIEDADSYQEALTLLMEQYDEMDSNELESLVSNYIYNASLHGDIDATP